MKSAHKAEKAKWRSMMRARFLRADFPHCRVKILVNPLGLTAFCVLHCKKSATQKIFNLKQAYF